MPGSVAKCRICDGKNLIKFLELGDMPPADGFLTESQISQEKSYPLNVCICDDCGLVQLDYVVAPEILYQNDYPYESSMTKTGVSHFHNFAKEVVEEFRLSRNGFVVDVGSNVGVLLEGFNILNMRTLGVEPATNICQIANKRGMKSINSFFTEDIANKIISDKKYGKAEVITATNVFAHIDDLHALMRAIDILLADKGVFIIEAPYLIDLFDNLEYDTIYHEHLSYLSIEPLIKLFDRFGMEILKVWKQKIHGGSLRYYIGRKNKLASHKDKKVIDEFLAREDKICKLSNLKDFAKRVEQNRSQLCQMLAKLKESNKRIVGVGAPAKGMTLLNYCKIDSRILDFVTEKSKLKIGKFTPGTYIPIVGDENLLNMTKKVDYVLLLPWNFADEIIKNLEEYRKLGGKFIIPIPEPHIIYERDI